MTVSCPECATKLRLKDRRAVGKRVKCPKCEVPFLVEIPAAGEEDPLDFLDDFDAAPPSRARSRSDEESDDVDDAPSKPKRKTSSKKKKKRRKSSADWQQPALIGGGVLLLLLLLGGGVYLATGTSINGNAVDMTYLPADADTLVKINVAEIMKVPLLNPLMQHEKVKEELNELSQKIGFSLNDVETMTLGVRTAEGNSVGGFPGMPVGVGGMNSLMGARNPIDFASTSGIVVVVRFAKAMNSQMTADAVPGSELVQHAGRDLIRRPANAGQSQPLALLFATDSLAIMGTEDKVKAAYDAGTIQVRRPEFDFVNPDMQLFYAYVPRDRQVFKNMAAIAPVPEGADKHVMEYTIGMGTGIDFNSDVDVEVWYSLESRSAASSAYRGLEAEKKQAREAVDNLKKLLNEQNAMLAMMAPNIKPSAEKIIAIAEQTVDSMSGSKSGSYYTMELTIPGSIGPAIQELVANMPDMSGMGGMAMPSGMPSSPSSYGAGAPAGAAFPGQTPPGGFPGGAAAMPAGPAGAFPGQQIPAQPPGGFPAGGDPARPGAVPPGAGQLPPGAGQVPPGPGQFPAGGRQVPPGVNQTIPGRANGFPAGGNLPGPAGALPANVPSK
ncbi:MAG: hypothetical protein WEB58_04830 [Planctomycetaceae bacterium]